MLIRHINRSDRSYSGCSICTPPRRSVDGLKGMGPASMVKEQLYEEGDAICRQLSLEEVAVYGTTEFPSLARH